MPRSGLLAALMICGAPAIAAPHMPVSLDGRVDTARPLNAPRDSHLVLPLPGLPGVPVTWDGLLNPGTDAPLTDICAMFGGVAAPNGVRLPFEPAQVLSRLVEHGSCNGEPG